MVQSLDEFIEYNSTTVDAQFTPWKHFFNTDIDTNEDRGWSRLIDSLNERYGPRDKSPRIVGDSPAVRRPLDMHPGMTSVLDNSSRSATVDDYPLWRVCCKVSLVVVLVVYLTFLFIYYSSSWAWKRKSFSSCFR